LFNLAPARFEFVQPLLKPRRAQAVGNGVNKAGELPVYVGEFAAPVVCLSFILAALSIDLFLIPWRERRTAEQRQRSC
jgi:hypothetical protein